MLVFSADKQLEVAQACSGIRSLLGLIAMSFTLSYLMLKRWRTKLILIVLAPPVAIFCNVFRVTFTGFAYRKISEKFAEGFLHLFTGWAIFILALGIMLIILKVLVILFETEFDEDKPEKAAAGTGPVQS